MFIRNILAPVYGDEKESSSLEEAFALAKQFNAHVTCLHISPDIYNLAYPAPVLSSIAYEEITTAVEKEVKEQAQKAESLFNDITKKAKISTHKAGNHDKTTAEWMHLEGNVNKLLAKQGRLHDLCIIDQSTPDHHEYYDEAITTLLFESGRPVIITPSLPADNPAKTISIAWDGSAEAARAVKNALPLLSKAEHVHIITIDESEDALQASGQELSLYLSYHNIEAHHHNVTDKKESDGACILDEAIKLNSDLIVMGAYTHNRIRELILGGVTHHLIHHAGLPVFMSH